MTSRSNSYPSPFWLPNQFIKNPLSRWEVMSMPVISTMVSKAQILPPTPAISSSMPKNSIIITIKPMIHGRCTVRVKNAIVPPKP
ncbi:MAG TPA: hypothetical protein VLD19_21415 [Chitinophagaceae bacterium]|nr:hypothetical protein [Chitinophagaceae bacterium]